MENNPITVSDCIALVNQTLEYAYPAVLVEGEVSSFKVNQGKYVFFDLKDSESTVGCFMMVYQLRMPIEDGMRVQVVASPKLTKWGKFSLTIREIRPVGQGSIKRSFELLKAKLENEGLFDTERKRLLPSMPARIGVITSTQAAGYIDFLTILNERWGGIEVEVAHTQVQGAGAAAQIVRAIEYFNQTSSLPEVLVIVRGGGSADDLAVFNDEPLVRAIAGSRIPTLVGVGHEVDVTLADLAADVRAATPSNAAQILVPDKREIIRGIDSARAGMLTAIERQLKQYSQTAASAIERLLRDIDSALRDAKRHAEQQRAILRQLDPKAALKRGYALVRDSAGNLIGEGVSQGTKLTIELERVIIEAGVEKSYGKN